MKADDLKKWWLEALTNCSHLCPPDTCTPTQWTTFIEQVYEALAKLRGWEVCHRGAPGLAPGRQGEQLCIDALFSESPANDYALPVLAIEHQNGADNLDRLRYCLWKLSLLRFPRFLIGYASSKAQIPPIIDDLSGLMDANNLGDTNLTLVAIGDEGGTYDRWEDYYSFYRWDPTARKLLPVP